jgi:hypothetical protein
VSETQSSFALRGRNPDVLTCIANLSNDEVFTPPEFANRMLDTLAEAWATDHGGANLWADKTVKFLDPFTKSGVFLREITGRLTEGLANEIPDLEERVDHILTRQVFGIGITHLTSLLARRSVYCSKHAKGKHSIAKSFASDAGNIWFERMEHSWVAGRCRYCGASQEILDRGEGLLDAAICRPRTALDRVLDLSGRLSRLQARRYGENVAHPARHERHQARQRLALSAQLQERARGAAPVAGHEGVDEAPHLALGRRRGDGLDLLDADVGALPVLERELLELAQEALLALAGVGDQRLGRGPFERDAEPLGLADRPTWELLGLQGGLDGDVAARLLDRRRELGRRLDPPVVARANFLASEPARPDSEALSGLRALYADPQFRAFHVACLPRRQKRRNGDISPEWALADAKLSDAETIDEAISWLRPKERMAILLDQALIARLALLPREPPGTDAIAAAG